MPDVVPITRSSELRTALSSATNNPKRSKPDASNGDTSRPPTPSYKGLKPASEAASRAKRANRKKDTIHELLLRRELWQMGLRYRKYVSGLPGNPDIVFKAARVVVFCDGDFWHGRNWPTLQAQLRQRHNAEYWIAKIGRNRERDTLNTTRLTESGWLVLRFWESDIVRDAGAVAAQVRATVVRALQRRTGRQPDEARREA